MGARCFDDDEVAMSESIGIGLLVGMTVIVTAVVGLNVLVVSSDSGGTPQANFTYEYSEDSGLLLVTHSRGDALQAGRIEFEGQGIETTKANWSELANVNRTKLVDQGDIVQLGESNAYGKRVSSSDTITVYYNESGNRTRLDQWNGA